MLSTVILFLNIGTGEMVLILFAALMLFGGNKLPELARGLGKGIRDFKDASEDVKREINNQINNYEDKKPEVHTEAGQETLNTFEPVAGTLPAYQDHIASDATDPVELNPEAPETYQENAEIKHPVTGHQDVVANEEKTGETVSNALKEEYK